VVFGGAEQDRKRRGRPQLRDTAERQELASDATTCAKAMTVREDETRGETVLSERNGGGNYTHKQKLSTTGRGVRTLWMSACGRAFTAIGPI